VLGVATLDMNTLGISADGGARRFEAEWVPLQPQVRPLTPAEAAVGGPRPGTAAGRVLAQLVSRSHVAFSAAAGLV